MPVIRIETEINAEKRIVFDLARSIDLHKLSTEQTNEEAIGGVTSGLIGIGQSVTWRARHFGIYQKLEVRISEYEKPNFFVDEMEKGAFKSFKHQHFFQEIGEKTKMIDIFDYVSPFGILGKLADKLFLKNYMRRFLVKRNEVIKEIAESNKWKEILNID